MNVKMKNLFLYGIFALMFFWDVLGEIVPRSQFIVLAILFALYIVKNKKIHISKVFLLVASYVAIQGIVSILVGSDTISLFIFQFGSIALCYIAYSVLTSENSIVEIFTVYWKSSYIMAFIGMIEVFLGLLNISALANIPVVFTFTQYYYRVIGFVRVASLCGEPSFLGYYLAPAVCLILFKILAPEFIDTDLKVIAKKFQCILIVAAYLMTFSATAYFGLAVMIALIWWKKGLSAKKIAILIIAIVAACGVYNFVPDIKMRVDDTLYVFLNESHSSNVNLSTNTYYTNYTVMKKSIAETWGFGSGLGSYQIMYDKFATRKWAGSELNLNRTDGNSALFRILTELGLPGMIALLYFIIHYFPKGKSKFTCYSCAVLVLICMLLLRQGNYTHGGSVLFVYLYVRLWKEQQEEIRNNDMEEVRKYE